MVASTSMSMWGSGKKSLGQVLLKSWSWCTLSTSRSSFVLWRHWRASKGGIPSRLTWCRSASRLLHWWLDCVREWTYVIFASPVGGLSLPREDEPRPLGQFWLCRSVTRRSSHDVAWGSWWDSGIDQVLGVHWSAPYNLGGPDRWIPHQVSLWQAGPSLRGLPKWSVIAIRWSSGP